MGRRRLDGFVMIAAISARYNIHPQTLRLYEREGLLKPDRTGGNTRLYGPDAIRRLEMILTLTRDLGVNLAGVEVILNMQREMEKLEMQADQMISYVRQVVLDKKIGLNRENALVVWAPRQAHKKSG